MSRHLGIISGLRPKPTEVHVNLSKLKHLQNTLGITHREMRSANFPSVALRSNTVSTLMG